MTDRPPYDYRNCASLFGYAAVVHVLSGGVCQLCGAGDRAVDFDSWRQLTVEHLIGDGQDGYLKSIKLALAERFPDLDPAMSDELASRLDVINTVSACSFCNSTTSCTRADVSMTELIVSSEGAESIEEAVRMTCEAILAAKQDDVRWKLEPVRRAFNEQVAPALRTARSAPRLPG